MELSNSNAKDWSLCREHGLSEADFREHKFPSRFGEVIMLRQQQERQSSEVAYLKERGGTNVQFVTAECVYISVLYSPLKNGDRSWLVSTFNAVLPPPHSWSFSGKSLVGFDADGGRLYEWYALSGSQFKYYPKLSSRMFGTALFEVPKPSVETLRAKAERLFGA